MMGVFSSFAAKFFPQTPEKRLSTESLHYSQRVQIVQTTRRNRWKSFCARRVRRPLLMENRTVKSN